MASYTLNKLDLDLALDIAQASGHDGQDAKPIQPRLFSPPNSDQTKQSQETFMRYSANGLYKVTNETKETYKKDREIVGGLSEKEISEVVKKIEGQARKDVENFVVFKSRERNSEHPDLIRSTWTRYSKRNDSALKNINMIREPVKMMRNGLTKREEVYIPGRKDSSSPIRGIEVTQRVYAGETMVEELRPPAPWAPLDQHSPWNHYDFDAGVIDAKSFRKKVNKHNSEVETFVHTPRFHDNKFDADTNELPYQTNAGLEKSILEGKGKLPIEKRERWEEALIEKHNKKSPMRIRWHNSRPEETVPKVRLAVDRFGVTRGQTIVSSGGSHMYTENIENKGRAARQKVEREKKVHFPRINYVKPPFKSHSRISKHAYAYNPSALQVDYPPHLHGIALEDKRTYGKVQSKTFAPPSVHRERVKLFEETEKWCKAEKDYLQRRGILKLCPDYNVLNNKHYQWIAELKGPVTSPYAHGIFAIKIILGDFYPTKPPRIVFYTPIFHPAIPWGIEKELKIHWHSGAAKWNHRFSLPAVCEIILQLLRFPETHVNFGRRAADVWEKNEDKDIFYREASSKARKFANAVNISELDLENGLKLVNSALHNLNPIEENRLSGAYVHFSHAFLKSTCSEKRGKIGGHRVILSPEFRFEKRADGNVAAEKNTGGAVDERRSASSHIENSIDIGSKYPIHSGRKKQGCQWSPGRRMLYYGMVKPNKNLRKQRAPDSILYPSLSKRQQMTPITEEETALYREMLSESDRSDLDESTGSESSASSSSSSNEGYTSDVTTYNTNNTNLFKASFRMGTKTNSKEAKGLETNVPLSSRSLPSLSYTAESQESDDSASEYSTADSADEGTYELSTYRSDLSTAPSTMTSFSSAPESNFSSYGTEPSITSKHTDEKSLGLVTSLQSGLGNNTTPKQKVRDATLVAKNSPYGHNFHSPRYLKEILERVRKEKAAEKAAKEIEDARLEQERKREEAAKKKAARDAEIAEMMSKSGFDLNK